MVGSFSALAQTRLTLGWLDGSVVLIFVLAILALGFSPRLRDNSILQFLAAGRALSLGPFVATLVCTWYGGILGIGESVRYFGWGTWLLLGWPYYVFGIIYALMFARRVREAPQLSLPERLNDRFGRGAAITGAALLFLLAVPAAHVLMIAVLVQMLTGWSLPVSAVVATLVGTIFLYRGGLLADVRIAMLAFVAMYTGFAVMLINCLVRYPGVISSDHIEPPELLQFSGGQSWVPIIGFFILGAWTLVDPGFHQRTSAASSTTTSQRGVLVCVACWVVFDLLSIGTGMYALALIQPPTENPLMTFPALGEIVLPPGLKALFLCGILGTIVTAMVGYSLVSGATVGRDLIGRLAAIPDERMTTLTRVGIGLSTIIAIALAVSIGSVVNLWYQWGGCVIGALLIPVCVAYLRPGGGRLSSGAITLAMLVSFATSFGWLIYGKRYGNPDLMVEVPGTGPISVGTLVPSLVVSAICLSLASLTAKNRRNYEHGTDKR